MEEKTKIDRALRRAVALAEGALPVIRAQGIGSVTADDLAQAMGISRATFFRHFATKDEALLFAVMGDAALFSLDMAQPCDLRGQVVWPVLRHAFRCFDAKAADSDFRDRLRLVLVSPALGSQLRLSRAPQIAALVDGLVACQLDPLIARYLVSAAVAVADRCLADWARADEGDLSDALDTAFAALARGY